MASTGNVFDLLRSGEQPPSSKNKKKKKSKQQSTTDAGVAAVSPTEPVATDSNTTSSHASEVVELVDAVPILEKSARTQGPNRIKLWKDWQRQATDRSPKALKYRAPDGSLIQFKELVLRSRALEIAVEGCIASPLSSDETSSLAQLLSTFIPRADTAGLANAIARLSELLAEDTQSFDTVGAAQRAVHNVVSTLKAAKDSEAAAGRPASLQERLSKIEREAGKQHGFLASVEKLAAAVDITKRAPTTSGISRAHVDSASELVKLYADKFDLLLSGAAPKKPAGGAGGAGASAATIKALEELKSVINGHLQEASALEQNVKGKAVSAEAKRAQAVASIRREEGVLAQQASELAGQIRQLESQLSQLRSQAAEIEDKRAKLHQRQSAALDALSASTGRKMPGLSAQHYHNELAAADKLLTLVDPSYCAVDKQEVAAAQAEHGNSAEQFMAAVRNMMQMSSSLLADVPSKVEFCRQRIAQADKLASLGGLGQEKSAKTREEATKLMNELVKNVADVLGGAHGALQSMRSRYTSFTQAQQAGLSQVAYEVEDLMGFIQRQHDAAMGAVRGQPATPAAATAAAAPGGGAHAGAAMGTIGGGGAGKMPAGAGAPGSLLAGGAAGGTPLAAPGVRPNYGANLGPIQPPTAAGGAKAAAAPAPKAAPAAARGGPTSNGHAAPVSAAAAVASTPAAASNDGFQPVGGKKNRRANKA